MMAFQFLVFVQIEDPSGRKEGSGTGAASARGQQGEAGGSGQGRIGRGPAAPGSGCNCDAATAGCNRDAAPGAGRNLAMRGGQAVGFAQHLRHLRQQQAPKKSRAASVYRSMTRWSRWPGVMHSSSVRFFREPPTRTPRQGDPSDAHVCTPGDAPRGRASSRCRRYALRSRLHSPGCRRTREGLFRSAPR